MSDSPKAEQTPTTEAPPKAATRCEDLIAAAAALEPWWQQLVGDAPVPLPSVSLHFPLLDHLQKKFALTDFETSALLLLALIEVDPPALARLEALGLTGPAGLTASGLSRLFANEYEPKAFLENSSLCHWNLLELGNNRFDQKPLVHRPLRINPRILAHLLRAPHLDDTLAPFLQPAAARPDFAPPVLTPAQLADTDAIVAHLSQATHFEAYQPILLRSPEADTLRAAAVEATRRLGLRLLKLDATDLPLDRRERHDWARRWQLEALLSEAALFIDATALRANDPAQAAVEDFARQCLGALIIGGSQAAFTGDPLTVFSLPPTTAAERAQLIGALLEDAPDAPSADACRLAEQFQLSATATYHHIQLLKNQPDHTTPPIARLWASSRQTLNPRGHHLMQAIQSGVDWSDLVLPDAAIATLRELTAQLRHRTTVYSKWGFAAKGTRGLNLTALFSGPSGTGKTLAAEVVANELQLDLMRVDLSAVVSKYIGETEENLRAVFDAAESGGVILLFDEADALFGPRSKVNDSKDRNANIEVSYLLQRLEAYRGLAILTTNFRENIDSAFLRRIRFHLDFPFPDPATRARIWQTVFPPQTPLNQIDFQRVARLSLTGGHIRNIALNAAFLAAEEGAPVNHLHIANAARNEFRKSEKPCPENELRALTLTP